MEKSNEKIDCNSIAEKPVFELRLSADGESAELIRNKDPKFSVTLSQGVTLLDWAKAFRGAGEFLKQIHYREEAIK